MEVVQKNKVLIGTIAGITVLGGVVYYFYSRKGTVAARVVDPPASRSVNLNESAARKPQFFKTDEYRKAVASLKDAVTSEKAFGRLSKVTLTSINRAIIELYKEDYIENYLQNRQARRRLVGDSVEYAAKLKAGADAGEELLEKATEHVLVDLNLPVRLYENETERLAREDANFAIYTIYLLETVKASIRSHLDKELTKENLVEFFRYQIHLYDEHGLADLKDMPFEELINVKQNLVSDLASIKYGIEEEDIIRHPALLGDPKVLEVQKELQNKVISEQQHSISFPY